MRCQLFKCGRSSLAVLINTGYAPLYVLYGFLLSMDVCVCACILSLPGDLGCFWATFGTSLFGPCGFVFLCMAFWGVLSTQDGGAAELKEVSHST